jgi:hypothetical protein
MTGAPIRRGPLLAVGALLVLVLSGCTYLFGSGFEDFEEFDDFGDMEPVAAYASGRATLEIGGETIVLGAVGAGSGLYDVFGAEATWSGADGWYLTISGATTEDGALFGSSYSWLTVDRIAGNRHLTTPETGRCIITVTQADEDGLVGTATCRGLRWADAIIGGADYTPDYVDEPAFDAEITFTADPGPTES